MTPDSKCVTFVRAYAIQLGWRYSRSIDWVPLIILPEHMRVHVCHISELELCWSSTF